MKPSTKPLAARVVWSIAGLDSGGGAGLSADQRAVEAMAAAWRGDVPGNERPDLHLCPVVACLTAQNSVAVQRIEPVSVDWLDAQLTALAQDMLPQVIKTGLLGSVAIIETVARWVRRLRHTHAVQLVVDPVLRASSGAAFADAAVLHAYLNHLLPLADVVTPNREEVARLLGAINPGADDPAQHSSPGIHTHNAAATAAQVGALAHRLADLMRPDGARCVVITGGDANEPLACDWLHSPHACGWLYAPRLPATNSHGTGCTFASALAAALALGFVSADAAVLAKMLVASGLQHGVQPGAGAGLLRPRADFATSAAQLARLSWPDEHPANLSVSPEFTATSTADQTRNAGSAHATQTAPSPPQGLYAIVDSLERLHLALQAGYREMQWRVKLSPPTNTAEAIAAHQAELASYREKLGTALAACVPFGARLWVNDHWREALYAGAGAVHLGQEDLSRMSPHERAQLRGLQFGISSHSLWELCRAAHLQPSYIACGPVWATLTKDMPWLPQGLDNLAWWSAVSPLPVVAIGGVLQAEQVRQTAASGAAAVALVRGLWPSKGEVNAPNTLQARYASLLQAWQAGAEQATMQTQPARLPHPTLPSETV